MVAKLIRFDGCPVVARFLKSREINGNSSKRIIRTEKFICYPSPAFTPICILDDPTRPVCRPSGVCPLLRSLSGVKRTWVVAPHMSAFDRFCCRSQQRQLRDGWRELKELPAIRSLARMVFLHCHRTLHSLCKARLCDRRWSDDQLCEPAEVLRDCR